jgi:hypothetical protein
MYDKTSPSKTKGFGESVGRVKVTERGKSQIGKSQIGNSWSGKISSQKLVSPFLSFRFVSFRFVSIPFTMSLHVLEVSKQPAESASHGTKDGPARQDMSRSAPPEACKRAA